MLWTYSVVFHIGLGEFCTLAVGEDDEAGVGELDNGTVQLIRIAE